MEVAGADKKLSNGTKPLNFISCTLLNGTKDKNGTRIPLTPKFSLKFDKNVVDALVWNNNKSDISMVTTDGQKIQTDITKIDDTIDFSYRQQIFIEPLKPLKPETSYKIVIAPKLTAKNGIILSQSTNGKGIAVPFTAQTVVKSDVIMADLSSGKNDTGFQLTLPVLDIVLIAVIIIWIVFEIAIHRRKKLKIQQCEKADNNLLHKT